MGGLSPDSVETWQCRGDGFDDFHKVITSCSDWDCLISGEAKTFSWQVNIGLLKSRDLRDDSSILIARILSSADFVQVQKENPRDVLVVMPVKGHLRFTSADASRDVPNGHALVYQPRSVSAVDHLSDDGGYEVYVLQLSFAWVQRCLTEMLHLPVDDDLHISQVIDLDLPKVRVLARLIATMSSDAFTFQSRHLSFALQQRLIETFSHLLLESIPHRYTARMQTPSPGPMPNYLRLARDYMHREALRNPSMGQVAAAAHISVRTLETSFRTHLDVTPLTYLRTIRLQSVREALANGADARSIGDIARAFGFPHAGRFAHYYGSLFGEAPSETRRRAKAV